MNLDPIVASIDRCASIVASLEAVLARNDTSQFAPLRMLLAFDDSAAPVLSSASLRMWNSNATARQPLDSWKFIRDAMIDHAEYLTQLVESFYWRESTEPGADPGIGIAKTFAIAARSPDALRTLESATFLAASWLQAANCIADQRLVYALVNLVRATQQVLDARFKQLVAGSSCSYQLQSNPQVASANDNWNHQYLQAGQSGIMSTMQIYQIEQPVQLSNTNEKTSLIATLKHTAKAIKKRFIPSSREKNQERGASIVPFGQQTANVTVVAAAAAEAYTSTPPVAGFAPAFEHSPNQLALQNQLNRAGRHFVLEMNAFLDVLVSIENDLQSTLLVRSDEDERALANIMITLARGSAVLCVGSTSPFSQNATNGARESVNRELISQSMDRKQKGKQQSDRTDWPTALSDTTLGMEQLRFSQSNNNSVANPEYAAKYDQVHDSVTRLASTVRNSASETVLPAAYQALAEHLVSLDELRIRSRLSISRDMPINSENEAAVPK